MRGIIELFIKSFLAYIAIALPLYLLGRGLWLKKSMSQLDWKRELLLAFLTLYLIGLASQTIIPKWGVTRGETGFSVHIHLTNELANINLIPFRTISQFIFPLDHLASSVVMINLFANIFMFIPIGFLVPLIWNNWRVWIKIVLLSFAIPCFIEFVQFFIGRSTDIDDVILNAIGVMIGYGFFLVVKKLKDAFL